MRIRRRERDMTILTLKRRNKNFIVYLFILIGKYFSYNIINCLFWIQIKTPPYALPFLNIEYSTI